MDFQPQIDKAVSKLSTWYEKNLTQAGWVSLKMVLSSQSIYLLTVPKPTKEIFEEIDKIRRCFLWDWDKALLGGKCNINRTKTSLPKEFGGLGILNMDRFATALSLRWLGTNGRLRIRPGWARRGPCTENDRLLFAACTTITLENGQKTPFWTSDWLQGRRPMDIAQQHMDPRPRLPDGLHHDTPGTIRHLMDSRRAH